MRKRVYRRHRQWYLDYTNHAGKRVRRIVPEAATKGDAAEVLTHSLHEELLIRQGYKDTLTNHVEVAGLLEDFLLLKVCQRRYKTVTAYRAALANLLGRFLTPEGTVWPPDVETPVEVLRKQARTFRPGALGASLVDEITPSKVQRHIDEHRRDRAIGTLNKMIVSLKAFLGWAVKAGRIKSNPLAGLARAGKPANRLRVFDVDEVERLLAVSPEPYRCYWLAFLTTGMRRSEFCKLRWPEVDLASTRTIRLLPETTKRGKQRDVPILPELQARLIEMRRTATDKNGYVFVNAAGKPWGNLLLRRFKRCVELALVGRLIHEGDSGLQSTTRGARRSASS